MSDTPENDAGSATKAALRKAEQERWAAIHKLEDESVRLITYTLEDRVRIVNDLYKLAIKFGSLPNPNMQAESEVKARLSRVLYHA